MKEIIEKFKKEHRNLKPLAINFKNNSNELTWHLIDYNMIEDFKNKQPVIRFGSITLKAEDYDIGTSLIYDETQNKKYIVDKNKFEALKNKNMDFEMLAKRSRMPGFGSIWNIESESMAKKYEEQLIGIKIENYIYLSLEYNPNVFIVRDVFSHKKYIVEKNGKITIKRK